MIISRSGDSLIRLKDVAEVELSNYELRSLSFSNGLPTMSMSVDREPGSNVIDIKRNLLPAVEGRSMSRSSGPRAWKWR